MPIFYRPTVLNGLSVLAVKPIGDLIYSPPVTCNGLLDNLLSNNSQRSPALMSV